jgi:hypothetical protein
VDEPPARYREEELLRDASVVVRQPQGEQRLAVIEPTLQGDSLGELEDDVRVRCCALSYRFGVDTVTTCGERPVGSQRSPACSDRCSHRVHPVRLQRSRAVTARSRTRASV